MYHPVGPAGVDGDEFEFIELKNSGPAILDLSGIAFTDGIQFTIPTGSRLAAGAWVVLVRNPNEFANRYPAVTIGGVYSGKLSNSGETVVLTDASGRVLLRVIYATGGGWTSADGPGYSLVPAVANQNVLPDDNGQIWRASNNAGGSPGADDLNTTPTGIRLQIDSVVMTPQGITIVFEADANRSYGIQWRDALASGDWIRAVDLPPKPQQRRETILDVAPGIQRFYRVVTP